MAGILVLLVALFLTDRMIPRQEVTGTGPSTPAMEGRWEGVRLVGSDGRIARVEGAVTFEDGRWRGGLRMRDTVGLDLPVDSGAGTYRLRGDTMILEDGESLRIEREGDLLTLVGVDEVRVELRRR